MTALAAMAGCAHEPRVVTRTQTVEVQVPVPIVREPPRELATPAQLPRPTFVAPTHPRASSALTPGGEADLRALLGELLARDRAWRAWASEPATTEQPTP